MRTLFFRNGRLLAMTIALIFVAGLSAFQTIPRLEDPVIINRFAQVITQYPGASAERVEALVTEPLEAEIRTIAEVKTINSTSRNGLSFISIELRDSVTEVDEVWSRIRDRISDARGALPDGALDPEFDDDRTYAFTMIVSLAWELGGEPNRAMLSRFAEELQQRLRNTSGTALVRRFGEPEEEILVLIDEARLSAFNLTAADVSAAIARADSKISAGQVRGERQDLVIEVEGALTTLDRIRRIPIRESGDGRVARVGDIATVSRGVRRPVRTMAFSDGAPAVMVAARMEFDQRSDIWSERMRAVIADFHREVPDGIRLEIVFDQAEYTDERLTTLLGNMLAGVGLVVLVLFLTLGWRNALVVAATLPFTTFVAIAVLNATGIPIHQMSITGLIVALGLLVDNAIVMVDSIRHRREAGADILTAISDSVSHLRVPLAASTVTTILAFMPIVLLPGPTGEFVGAIGISVIVALITSYLLSMTVIPALAGRFSHGGQAALEDSKGGWWRAGIRIPALTRAFERSLDWSLRHPWKSVAAAMVLPIMGFVAAGGLTEQFFPPADRDQFHIEVKLPNSASIAETERVVRAADELLRAEEGIEQVHWFLGQSAPSFYYNLLQTQDGASFYAQAMVNARSVQAANRLIPRLQRRFDDALPEARILVRKLEQGPPFDAPIELRIFGADLETLDRLAERYRSLLASVPTVIHTETSLRASEPKLWFRIDEEAARLAGLTLSDIADQMQFGMEGAVGGSIVEGSEVIPVRVRVGERRTLEDVVSRLVVSPANARREGFSGIPLSALGELHLEPVLGAIPRRDGERVNTLRGYLQSGVLPEAGLAEFRARIEAANIELPSGYHLEIGGESEKRNESVGKLAAYVGLITVLMVAVIVMIFNSFRLSAVIFAVGFQAMGLGLLSLAIGGYPLGFVVIIGLMGLFGLAINAGIIITAAIRASEQAMTGDAGAVRRVVVNETSRHIVSTTITTVGGFLPLILSEGGFWPPFAVAIAGGTLFSTILSFYFVPAINLVIIRATARRQARRAARGREAEALAGAR